jgi:hypothetical protein
MHHQQQQQQPLDYGPTGSDAGVAAAAAMAHVLGPDPTRGPASLEVTCGAVHGMFLVERCVVGREAGWPLVLLSLQSLRLVRGVLCPPVLLLLFQPHLLHRPSCACAGSA